MKSAKLENNIILWNAVCEDNDNAKVLFAEVVHRGLEIPDVNFTISQYDRNRKFLKVTLNKKDDKLVAIKKMLVSLSLRHLMETIRTCLLVITF